MSQNTLALLGYASGMAAGNKGCGDGPLALQRSNFAAELEKISWCAKWDETLFPAQNLLALAVVSDLCARLASYTKQQVEQRQFFSVVGGDHSCAIGTWSGVASALDGALGLIWVDAHMDSHTDATTPSGNIHGMPLACLLGHGAKVLTDIAYAAPKLLPEHICLIGVRSFEKGEAELLKHLGVRIYFIEEVQQRGLAVVMQEALGIVKQNTAAFGISIDLDGIDPHDAPGVGSPEANGLSAEELLKALPFIALDPQFIGSEITEYNPARDQNNKTLHLLQRIIIALLPEKKYHE